MNSTALVGPLQNFAVYHAQGLSEMGGGGGKGEGKGGNLPRAPSLRGAKSVLPFSRKFPFLRKF